MKLWLDDIREPWRHGCLGYEWAKSAAGAIALLKTGRVTFASLDHDLAPDHYGADADGLLKQLDTGYSVVCWMEEHGVWPVDGVRVHSMNPAGRARMEAVIERNGKLVRRLVTV